jgi:hypothetical protein
MTNAEKQRRGDVLGGMKSDRMVSAQSINKTVPSFTRYLTSNLSAPLFLCVD